MWAQTQVIQSTTKTAGASGVDEAELNTWVGRGVNGPVAAISNIETPPLPLNMIAIYVYDLINGSDDNLLCGISTL